MNTSGCHIQLFALSASAPVNWRLLSGNHREVARGKVDYRDIEDAQLAIKRMQSDIALLHRRIQRVEPNRWTWELSHGGTAIVAAGHPFDRLIRCEQGLQRFLFEFAEAPIRAGVVVSARRWRNVS